VPEFKHYVLTYIGHIFIDMVLLHLHLVDNEVSTTADIKMFNPEIWTVTKRNAIWRGFQAETRLQLTGDLSVRRVQRGSNVRLAFPKTVPREIYQEVFLLVGYFVWLTSNQFGCRIMSICWRKTPRHLDAALGVPSELSRCHQSSTANIDWRSLNDSNLLACVRNSQTYNQIYI